MNRFNLVDEAWIPITNYGNVSLREVFENKELLSLGGTPIEKISILKLLTAIAQSATTPNDFIEWKILGVEGFSKACLEYLDKWHDAFYLYGDKPFLQFPDINWNVKNQKSFGYIIPEISTGNSTVLSEYNVEKELTDSQKAIALLTQMSMAFSGKKGDNKIVLSKGYTKKPSCQTGNGMAHMGLLHSFAFGKSLIETLYINLFTKSEIEEIGFYEHGVGVAPWEQMPLGEDCETANKLQSSLMGRLIGLGRFCYYDDNGIFITEGIRHLSHKEGIHDLSITTKKVKKETKAVWTDPTNKPWRQLTSLLGFICSTFGTGDCYQLKYAFKKANDIGSDFIIWSGGVRVSSNAGEQYLTGSDCSMESIITLFHGVSGDIWFQTYVNQIKELDELGKKLYGCVSSYNKEFELVNKEKSALATSEFWQMCGSHSQQLVDYCDERAEDLKSLRKKFADYVLTIYDKNCPNETARQLMAWAKCRPNLANYLNGESSETK